jgi:inosine-uridine nucleoside N-ribohydrolase
LLDSAPDALSPLSGRELAARKVRLVSVMGGNFDGNKPEFNIMTDVPSAQKLVANWPGEMVFSGFEIGNAILYPAVSIDHDFASGNPVPEAYRLYQKMPYDRPSWDLTAVLYAFRPDRGYFSLSDPGQISITEDGRTNFQVVANGHQRFLKIDAMQAQRSREALLWLASESPTARRH